MKQTLTTYQIAGLLMADQNARWTRPAAYALAEYYQELEESSGEELEFDAVAIRCDWNEYATAAAIAETYGIYIAGQSEQEAEDTVIRYINRNGSGFIRLSEDAGFLVQVF